MDYKDIIPLEEFKIRRHYDKNKEKWYFSVIDIVAVLIEAPSYNRARIYWATLKSRLKKEGSQVVDDCQQIRMTSSDGKQRKTDVADTEAIFRLIQSIPSKKTEPIKLWLAKVGRERIQEINDPEQSLNRARENWLTQGRSQEWVQRRMSGQETRNKLTDYWDTHGIRGNRSYAALTNIIHQEWSGLSIKKHKQKKSLKSQNLRDHMSEAELLLTALAELSTRQIAEKNQAEGLPANKEAARRGGGIARNTRQELEKQTGKDVITSKNFLRQRSSKQIKQNRNKDLK